MDCQRLIEWGYPLSMSRETDIPKFHMRSVETWWQQGFVIAGHPQRAGIPTAWSLKREDVHSLVWWSKDYRTFLRSKLRPVLDTYRQFFNFTITGAGGTESEPNVPGTKIQLEVFKLMVDTYGPEKLRWRCSPLPQDLSSFDYLCREMSSMGITECYFSFLHSGTRVEETRTKAEQSALVTDLYNTATSYGIQLLGCWDDLQLPESGTLFQPARCIDADKIDKIYSIDKFGLKHPQNTNCGCSHVVDVGQQDTMPCPHNCNYCYAAVVT